MGLTAETTRISRDSLINVLGDTNWPLKYIMKVDNDHIEKYGVVNSLCVTHWFIVNYF